jgi:hypothetical protein
MGSHLDWIRQEALERHAELLRNPAHQAAMRYFEEMERNPVLRMLHRQSEQEARYALFNVTRHAVRELDRFTAGEHLRSWERHISDWVLNTRPHSLCGLDLMLGNNREVERLMASVSGSAVQARAVEDLRRISQEAIRRVEMSGLAGGRDWTRVLDLSRQFTDVFRALPPEAAETYLGQAARRLEAIRESAETQDAEKFDQEVSSLAGHLLGWFSGLVPHKLTSEAMLGLLIGIIGVLLTAGQTGLSYKWRLDDKADAERQSRALERKLDEKFGQVLSAILERQQEQDPDVGKTYVMERTSAVFSRPGPKRPRVGYVFAGQKVRAVATTGRWIFIEYADPFNLEMRAGWIRKKYARLEK